MTSSPRVSVIIPTFNRANVLPRAVESVLGQSFPDFELIVVDDGSTDGTQLALSKFQDRRLKIISTENRGVSGARNLAAKAAKGEWLAFLDSDDEWLSTKLARQLPLCDFYDLVHGEEIWIRNGVRVNQMKKHKKGGGDQFLASLKLCAISPSTAMIKKEVFFELGGFREDFPVCEDYDLWLKFTSLKEVGFVKEPVIKKFGGHEDQLSKKFQVMDIWRVRSLKWIFDNRELSAAKREALLDVLAKKLSILAKGCVKHGNLKTLSEVKAIQKELAPA